MEEKKKRPYHEIVAPHVDTFYLGNTSRYIIKPKKYKLMRDPLLGKSPKQPLTLSGQRATIKVLTRLLGVQDTNAPRLVDLMENLLWGHIVDDKADALVSDLLFSDVLTSLPIWNMQEFWGSPLSTYSDSAYYLWKRFAVLRRRRHRRRRRRYDHRFMFLTLSILMQGLVVVVIVLDTELNVMLENIISLMYFLQDV
jgi:hypothetical protein